MTLQGTLQDINTFLTNGGIKFTASANPPTSIVMNILLEDNGNTGSGGALSIQNPDDRYYTLERSADGYTGCAGYR